MINYKFGTYEETADGKIFAPFAFRKCDSDAQAEHMGRRLCEDNGLTRMTIKRADAIWTISA